MRPSGGAVDARTVDFRPAGLADCPALAAIEVAAWRRSFAPLMPDAALGDPGLQGTTEQRWRARFQVVACDVATDVAVAPPAGVPVGLVRYGRPAMADGADAATREVHSLYVHPDVAGRGIGGRLLRHALSRLAADGGRDAIVWVLTDNRAARRFYCRHGGRRVDGAVRRIAWRGAARESVAYRWDLTGLDPHPASNR